MRNTLCLSTRTQQGITNGALYSYLNGEPVHGLGMDLLDKVDLVPEMLGAHSLLVLFQSSSQGKREQW